MTIEQEFPVSTYLALEHELHTEKVLLEKEQAGWLATRASLTEIETDYFDKQFSTIFERLPLAVQSGSANTLREYHDELAALVQKGAAASLMSLHELGDYNLAMFIKDIYLVHGKEQLEMTTHIVRMTIIAGADLEHQKVYVGNGGINSLEQLCTYLALGINDPLTRLTAEQYACCYRIFPWIAGRQSAEQARQREHHEPFYKFVQAIRSCPAAEDLQEKTLLRIMALGWTPGSMVDEWLHVHPLTRMARVHFKWLTLLLPYDHDVLAPYLGIVRTRINPALINALLNAFTSDRKIRKEVRAFFSRRPHWLLKTIISSTPDKIFDLIRRNEQDLLATFLKHYKQDIIALRNKDNQSVLQYAMESRNTVENTIQLLRQAAVTV